MNITLQSLVLKWVKGKTLMSLRREVLMCHLLRILSRKSKITSKGKDILEK